MELATVKPPSTNGCMASLFIGLIFLSFIVGSCAIVSRSVADLGDSTAEVLTTKTEQAGLTDRTRIEWRGRVEVAQIEADADKKTSFAFVLFWVTRLLTWAAVGVMVLAGGAWVWQEVREEKHG